MEIWRFVASGMCTGSFGWLADDWAGVTETSSTAKFSTPPSRVRPGGATYTLMPVRKRYWRELPLTDAGCGSSSTKKMSEHSLLKAEAFWTPSRMIREECGSIRIERGEALSSAPHDVPVVPVGRKRLSPFSARFQS